MKKIIPPGLNYADIKPEAIENQIRVVKFTPIATIQNARPNDVIRFQLQGNGFFDPYSAYIKFKVQVDPDTIANPQAVGDLCGKFIDRSAHSFISRLVIRSQGTELERIEMYDVMAAMINDMVYSSEQTLLHHYEGFATQSASQSVLPRDLDYADQNHSPAYFPFLTSPISINTATQFVDVGFWKYRMPIARTNVRAGDDPLTFMQSDGFPWITGQFSNQQPVSIGPNGHVNTMGDYFPVRTSLDMANVGVVLQYGPGIADAYPGKPTTGQCRSYMEYEFCIPIYSGIIGVLQPDKKFIPLSLLPLEVEFYMNPYALYGVGPRAGANQQKSRSYTISSFEIWAHTLFFEQELHRSLEAVVAESGIFIHYNTFYQTSINTYNRGAQAINRYNILGMYMKSINSIHWTFLYNTYEGEQGTRKLHFCCHNTSSIQLRNGMELTPSEPIQGLTGGASLPIAAGADLIPGQQFAGQHSQFLIETYKAWNKMHDPLSDSAINALNYNIDDPYGVAIDVDAGVYGQPSSASEWLGCALKLGRCQYGLSLEGEELGGNKQLISGKRSVMPFDLYLNAYKSAVPNSFMMCYLRADFIIYVRPDLVVTRLGL